MDIIDRGNWQISGEYISPTHAKNPETFVSGFVWQGKKASNPRPTVLETAALPAELFPYKLLKMVDRQGLEPRTDRL